MLHIAFIRMHHWIWPEPLQLYPVIEFFNFVD